MYMPNPPSGLCSAPHHQLPSLYMNPTFPVTIKTLSLKVLYTMQQPHKIVSRVTLARISQF